MRAAWFEAFGPAREVLQVGERETPAPGPGEVLVRLEASAVNPSDVKKRAGAFGNLLEGGYVIPNSDGAGVIAAVGETVAMAFAETGRFEEAVTWQREVLAAAERGGAPASIEVLRRHLALYERGEPCCASSTR